MIIFGTVLVINFAIIPSCLNYACNVGEIDSSGKGAYAEKIRKDLFSVVCLSFRQHRK